MKYKRLDKIWTIVELIWKFFERNVLSFGLLKSKLFRCIISIIALCIISAFSVLFYKFWTVTGSTLEQTREVLDVYTCTIIMWVFAAFIFMKVLFVKTDSFVGFTQQLPATKREVNSSILIFQLFMSFIFILIISSSLNISLVSKYGIEFITRIICNVFFTGTSIYILLEFIYIGLSYIVCKLKLDKMLNIIMFCFMIGMLSLMYSVLYNRLVDTMLFNYVEGKGTSMLLVYTYILDNSNFLLSLITFIVFVLLSSFIIINIPIERNNLKNSYVKFLRSRKRINMLSAYIMNFARGIDTYNYLCIAAFSFLFSIILKNDNAIYSLFILSINGVYAFIQTDSLRIIQFQKRYNAVTDYINLILSQFIYIVIVSIPFVISSLVMKGSLKKCFILYLVSFLLTIIFTLVGILFPPKRENPFSAIIGIVVISLMSILILATYLIFNLSLVWNVIIVMLIILFCIYYSILGLEKLKGVVRFEN